MFCVSTTGLSPVTVMVSSSEPTFISTLIGAVKLLVSSTPSRFTVPKPASEKVTGRRAGTEVDDLVGALVVRDRRARFLDQRGTAGFDGDAGQHAARRILDHAGNAAGGHALRTNRRRTQDDTPRPQAIRTRRRGDAP